MKIAMNLMLAAAVVLSMGATEPQCNVNNTCELDADCAEGQVCEPEGPGCQTGSICMDGCREDTDCGSGQACLQPNCFTCPCPGTCEEVTEGAGEGEQCGDDIGVICQEDLYCAHGWCGTPPVIGTCRAMGTCDWEGNCYDENNVWAHDDCEGEAACVEGQCVWICDESAQEGEECGDDIGVQCAEGLFCAHGWCGTPPMIGTCRTMGTCDWEGNCYDENNQWAHDDCEGEAVCEAGLCKWICDGGAQQGEQCGDDIEVQCAAGLYCAHGWCGTPPVIGICLAMGTCDWEGNCYDENNDWAHDACEGSASCLEGACNWECGGP